MRKEDSLKVLGVGSAEAAEKEGRLVVEADCSLLPRVAGKEAKVGRLAGKGALVVQRHLHQLHRWAPQLALAAVAEEMREAEERAR